MLSIIIISISILLVLSQNCLDPDIRTGNIVEVSLSSYQSIMKMALVRQGYSDSEAEITSDTLLYAEKRGNNQGVVKLLTGALKPNPNALHSQIRAVQLTSVSAVIDGGQKIGMAVLHEAVQVALEKARIIGISVAAATNYSSATGAIGYWARKIADSGFVGIVMSQCPEMVAPYGSYEPIFGTNPIAISIPTSSKPIVMDMATSAAAYFGLVTADREGQSIASDIAYDEEGRETTSPAAAMRGALRVFDRGHKGSALALMVELLAGNTGPVDGTEC